MGHLGAILGHPGAILGKLGGYMIQDYLVEMPKSLSQGACAAKTLALEHRSSTTTPCDMENVDFTKVL